MARKLWIFVAIVFFCSSPLAFSKKKEKPVVPEVLLRAQTVVVIIQPDAGEPMNDPTANSKAREQVEKAFLSWGRYRLVQETSSADIVVTVKKGTDKAATPTISGGPVDSRPVTVESTDNAIRIGAQQGRPTDGSQQSPDPMAADGRAHQGVEAGSSDDSFQVYIGGESYRPYSASIWSYRAKNALRAPDVVAVQQFRKAITDAEKAAAQKQPQQSPPQPQAKNP
jgi:hypothetical protein